MGQTSCGLKQQTTTNFFKCDWSGEALTKITGTVYFFSSISNQ